MEKETVSIVVPVYKTPCDLLLKCLYSLREQSYQKLDILVIDDGTPDCDYTAVAEKFEADSRFSFYRKENGGLSDARNYGIDRAKGEFICFVDSDDFVDKEYVSGLYRAIGDADVAVCGTCETPHSTVEASVSRAEFCSNPTRFCRLPYINFATNKLYRLRLFSEHDLRFPCEKGMIGEDAIFHREFFKFCTSLCSIDQAYYHYVPNTQSITHTFNPDFWKWEKQIIDWQWALFHTNPLIPEEERYMRIWLYFKFKDCINYYLRKEKDTQICNDRIDSILKYPLIKELAPLLKEKRAIGLKDRLILWLWLNKGTAGIRFFDKAKQIAKLQFYEK